MSFLVYLVSLTATQVFIMLDLNGVVASISVYLKDNELNTIFHLRSAQLRTSLLLQPGRNSYHLMSFRKVDVTAPLGGYNVNCCYTDAPHSIRLCQRDHRQVPLSLIL
jgi:hypothetical protein